MNKYLIALLSLSFLFGLTGCLSPTEDGETTINLGKPSTKKGAKTSGPEAVVGAVQLVNDQIVITGSGLNGVTGVTLSDGGSLNTALTFVSKSVNSLILSAASSVQIPLGSLVNLVLSEAAGATAVSVTFELPDSSVTAVKIADGAITKDKLDSMGAANGEVLVYDTSGGGSWTTAAFSGLNMVGTWNANINSPSLADGGVTTSPTKGDFYIIGIAGNTSIDGSAVWTAGDWIIYNGTTWDRVANTSDVISFKGRQGVVVPALNDYTWAQIDKSSSPVGDLSNVSTVGAVSGSILKYDGADWVVGTDDSSGGGISGPITSSDITDNEIVNADISGTAAISQSKIVNLTTDLSAKLSLAGGTMTGDLTMGANNIVTTGLVDGVDVSALGATVSIQTAGISANTTSISGKEAAITLGLTTDYFRGDKTFQNFDTSVRAATLTGFSSGAGTVSAGDTVLTAINKLNGNIATLSAGSGDFEKDGSVAMTGGFDAGGNSLSNISTITTSGDATFGNDLLLKDDDTNYITVKSPANVATDFTLTLPVDDGTTNQALVTDGSGVLSWASMPTSGLSYIGDWNATANTPTLASGGASTTPANGDFYIVGTAGVTSIDGTATWSSGDWIVFDGTVWDRVANSSGVASFKARTGAVVPATNDYTWAQIDKTSSPIDDLSDVDTTTSAPTAGQVLKWDGTNWAPSAEAGLTTVLTGNIVDGEIVNADISGTAAIAQSKISNLTTDLSAKLDLTGGTMTGTLTMGANNIVTTGLVDGIDVSTLSSSVTTNASNISANTTSISGKETSFGPGTTLEYFRGDKSFQNLGTDVRGTSLTGFTSGAGLVTAGDNILTALQKIDGNVNTLSAGSGDFKKDGSVAMTASFDGGGNSITNVSAIVTSADIIVGNDLLVKDDDTNYVTIKSPANVTVDYSLTLPSDDGVSGQVLRTDGSGVLSWITTGGTGTVTAVSANAPLSLINPNTTPIISISQANTTTDGYLSDTDWNTFNGKQGSITTGTTAQYLKGDLSLGTFSTDAIAAPITGFSTGAGTVAATDTILQAIQKLDANANAAATSSGALSNIADIVINADSDSSTTGAVQLQTAGTTKMIILNGGNVGIGTATPTQELEVNGDVLATAFYYTSDRRLKTNIEDIKGLEMILALKGVRFDWIKDGRPDIGLIAQKVEEVLPELVHTDPVTGLKSVQYGNLVSPLIEATKSLHEIIVKNREEIDHLKNRNDELENRLDLLELRFKKLLEGRK